ncbi:hypothetical protein P3X46_002761 [Hevea brasiliensis]|uniref:DUF4283 domain-containing protein n=1 Tax=Hevea brasiliensis TaxID=3981 RepID=A0ABQ9N6A7_HEVBR|nr:hypothetical protein P3X46_002761 [Hevea brasiliensis]
MHESRTGEFLDNNDVSYDDSDGDVDLEDDPPWKFKVILKVLGRSIGVLSDGPSMVVGHYLTVHQWRPNFDPDLAQIEKAMVWIRVHNLPVEIGVPIRIDDITLGVSPGKFARMCVKVDLTKPLLSKFKFRRRIHKIEYEGINLICFECGVYGHR